jgi:hypothetical protein
LATLLGTINPNGLLTMFKNSAASVNNYCASTDETLVTTCMFVIGVSTLRLMHKTRVTSDSNQSVLRVDRNCFIDMVFVCLTSQMVISSCLNYGPSA